MAANGLRVLWIFQSMMIVSLQLMTSEESIVKENRTAHFAKRGLATTITCKFSLLEDRDIVRWIKDGDNLIIHDSSQALNVSQNGRFSIINMQYETATLQINNVSLSDAGMYVCKLIPKVSGTLEQHERQMIVQDGPILKYFPTVTENESILLECCVTFTSFVNLVKYVWTIDHLLETSVRSNFTFHPESYICSNVSFKANRRYHNQILECTVANQLNSSAESRIQVQFPANAEWKPPYHSKTSLIAETNSLINITCVSDGYPSPKVILQRYDESIDTHWFNLPLIPELETRKGTKEIWTFIFNFTSQATQRLRCIAVNHLNDVQNAQGFLVATFIPVKVELLTVQAYYDVGNNITILCATRGRPEPSVVLQKKVLDRWETLTQTLPFAKNVTNDLLTWEFHLTTVTNEQAGDYRCRANNTLHNAHNSNVLGVYTHPSLNDFIMENLQAIISLIIGVLLIVTVITGIFCQRRNASRNLFPASTRYRGVIRHSLHFGNDSHPPANVPGVCQNDAPQPPDTRNMPVRVQYATGGETLATYEDLRDNDIRDKERNMVCASLSEERVNYAVLQKKRRIETEMMVTEQGNESEMYNTLEDETNYSLVHPRK